VSDFTPEESVPTPKPRRVRYHIPVKDLEVGQSILFPKTERYYVATTASNMKKKTGKEFTVRAVDTDNCRIWRTK
jgi:hypothetical protein